MNDETKDGFDARGLCDECQRTRKEGHALACICHPHWARTETPVAVDGPTAIQTAWHAIRAAQAGEGAAADPAGRAGRDLSTILADWRERIAQARQCGEDSTSTIPNLWQTIYDIDRDELDRVIAAVPAVAVPGLAKAYALTDRQVAVLKIGLQQLLQVRGSLLLDGELVEDPRQEIAAAARAISRVLADHPR